MIQMTEKFRPLFRPKRHKIFYGGRGGAKSWAIAQAILIKCAEKETRVLCTRELQGSIRESVHKLLSDTIERLDLAHFFNINVNTITGKNGSSIIFEGLKNNTTKIKSMEGIDIVWCEEAEAISEYSWELLIPTIRKGGSEIWISFNPSDEMDATYQNYVFPYIGEIATNGFYEDDEFYVCKVGYQDNPWFPEELRKEMERCKKHNYKKYLHIWDGEPNTDYEDSIIQPEWIEAAIDAHIKLGIAPRGVRTLGFDPADEGQDAKAYVMRHGLLVQACEQWQSGDVEDATIKIHEIAQANKCTDLVYDNIGIGTAVKIKMRELIGNSKINVQGFGGANTPDSPDHKYAGNMTNKDTFRNKRAQYWWYLRDRFEATYRAVEKGEYTDPDELISLDSGMENLKLLKAELCRVQRKRSRALNSLIQIESKQDMKSRGMKSPNLADALVYSFANKLVHRTWGKQLDYSNLDKGMRNV